MSATIQILAVSVAAFASTNVDALFLLIALYAAAEREALRISLGYIAPTVGVAALAWASSSALEQLPTRWLDYLGVIPIGLGLARARDLVLPPRAGAAPPVSVSFRITVLATLAQSPD